MGYYKEICEDGWLESEEFKDFELVSLMKIKSVQNAKTLEELEEVVEEEIEGDYLTGKGSTNHFQIMPFVEKRRKELMS